MYALLILIMLMYPKIYQSLDRIMDYCMYICIVI